MGHSDCSIREVLKKNKYGAFSGENACERGFSKRELSSKLYRSREVTIEIK
jgi:hypothetical protein